MQTIIITGSYFFIINYKLFTLFYDFETTDWTNLVYNRPKSKQKSIQSQFFQSRFCDQLFCHKKWLEFKITFEIL